MQRRMQHHHHQQQQQQQQQDCLFTRSLDPLKLSADVAFLPLI
jgi:hypothetical protein